ncbi:type I-E CRISPR-associated protein Cse2/CasB [Siccirubricoccus phaeus]|uniref:type I-E CRISPR-associated protein Cse2/CasB n=1 Tax=Siccirubricoccus phaeus TaxID=2595053 RepID=UPI0011F40305|nr:type I-E CRISPR-associated protein Cse2/CasB [Siccirubricoccus phaeus]
MIRYPQGAHVWWRGLRPDPGRANPADRSGDRAALARLRRCATVAAAMQEPATLALFRLCQADHAGDLVPIALAAAVLAHLREDRPEISVARQLGPESPERPETARLKPLRFRRLLEASEPDDCLAAFRRLLALAGGEANARDLARALFEWTDRFRGEEVRRRWIFAYWNANPQPTPATPSPAEAPAP